MAYKAFFDEHRTFGIELEVYGIPHIVIERRLGEIPGIEMRSGFIYANPYSYWRVTDDNSITGDHAAEIKSPILCGREGLADAARVASALADIGCRVNKTCGYHVHWNCADFTGKNVLSLLRFYAKFEGVIDYFVSPSRRGNSNKHCRSMIKDSDLRWVTELDETERALAVDIVTRFSVRHVQRVNRERISSRYHKVNIAAYSNYGTVEFRQHQGTIDPEKVTNWLLFTQQIVNKAKHVSVSRQVSAKPTLGEMLRVLKIVDHEFIENQCTDILILRLGEWLKKRYTLFREGMRDE